jgi:hypothetical protein
MRYAMILAAMLSACAFAVPAKAGPCYYYPPNVYWCY